MGWNVNKKTRSLIEAQCIFLVSKYNCVFLKKRYNRKMNETWMVKRWKHEGYHDTYR